MEPIKDSTPKKRQKKEAQESFSADFIEELSQEFSESPEAQEEPPVSVEGVYKRDGLTVTLGPDILPSFENVIVLFDYDSKKHSKTYDEYVVNILASLNLEKDFLFNKKPDFSFSGYNFFQISEHQLICIRVLTPKENPSPFYQRVLEELRHMFTGVEINQIFDTSLYFVLEENRNISISPLQFLNEINTSDSNPISITLPYSLNSEKKLVLETKKEWEIVSNTGKSPTSNYKKDKIDFHLDDPALEDKLGRKPIAKSLAKLINDDIFGNERCYAFMTHLQGRWGEGKSSFMKFLEDGLQEAGDNQWIIVHYNAWKHQNVDPPWWTFLDAIYQQGREFLPIKYRRRVMWNEWIRRMNSGVLLGFSIFAFLILLILSASNLLGISFLDLPTTTKYIVSVSTIAASLLAISQAWSKFFVMDTPENARLFMRKAENPSSKIKQHFKELIEDLQQQHPKLKPDNHIAVFIDDLDRCDGKFLVSLLEGIQTMFNEQKVFYLVAADKHWIAKSFENVYSEYIDTVKKGTKLGYSFIEKNFQLSIRLPNPSKDQISRYWSYILKHPSSLNQDNGGDKKGLKTKLQETGQEAMLSGEANLEELADEYNTSIEEAQAIMLETVNETTKDLEHLLMDHHELLGNNPRAVKRLANQYTVYRNLVLIEQNKVDPLKLFRWVVLQNRWPVLTDKLEQDPTQINDYDELLKELNLVSYSNDISYVIGTENQLSAKDVITFTGIESLTREIQP